MGGEDVAVSFRYWKIQGGVYNLERMWVCLDSGFLNLRCLAYSVKTPHDMPPDGSPCYQRGGRLVLSLVRLPDPTMGSRGQKKISNATGQCNQQNPQGGHFKEERFGFFDHNLKEKKKNQNNKKETF